MLRQVWANRVVRRMTPPLPNRSSTGTGTSTSGWTRFSVLARQSRSAPELLGSVLGHRVIVHPLRHYELVPTAPMPALWLPDHLDGVLLDEHLLIDASPPHLTLGLSYALVVPGRLPANVRSALHGERTVDQLLDAVAAFWTSETLDAEELTAEAASFPTDRSPDTPMLRLTRRLSLIGTPVAIVVDELPQPPDPATAGPATATCGGGTPLARH